MAAILFRLQPVNMSKGQLRTVFIMYQTVDLGSINIQQKK